MRTLRLSLLAAVLATIFWAPAALAADIPRLDGPVTDRAGVLGSDTGQLKSALDDLLRDHDVQLFVLFVGTTSELSSTEFADQTAAANSLGANDALLLVAVDDHTDAIWISDSLIDELTDPELDAIIADDLEPKLRDGDFSGAVIATAGALGEASMPAPIVTSPPATAPSDQGGGSGAGSLDPGPLLGLILLVIGLAFVAVWVRSRLTAQREAEERDRQTGRLAREANAGLLAIDERIRNADQEAGFVEAEFGEAEAAPFHAAIEEARGELKAAFGIRQTLDDDVPEDAPTREALLKEIVDRCARASAALDRQAIRIDELRHLERNAATILAALPARVEAQEQRLPGAEAALATLTGYADATWGSVKGNVVEARKGLAGARSAIDRGTAALTRKDDRAAAHEIVMAQDGIAGATALLDAVDKLVVAARDAEAQLADELKSAESDLEAARAAVPQAAAGGAAPHAADLTAAAGALRSASAAAAATPLDPLAAHKLAISARRGAGDVLVAVRQDAAQQQQFVAAFESSLASAEADVDRAADFITTRRGGVGRRARTRLAEAERMLETATGLRATDPKGAMDAARRAEKMAEEAYSLASQDFAGWDRGGPSPGRGGSDVAGAILGGIIGGILAGGGRRGGGGWGGSPWGSSGPFGGGGGWGGGGGHSRGGGFGGFGGGGGGGGHSRGGRW